MRKKQQVFAILRVDEFLGDMDIPIENKVTVKQIVSSRAVAEREVERLSRVNADKQCRYLWKPTRFVEVAEKSGS